MASYAVSSYFNLGEDGKDGVVKSFRCIEVSYYVKLFGYLFVTVQGPAARLWMHFLYPIQLLHC